MELREDRSYVAENLLEDHRRLSRFLRVLETIARRVTPESKADYALAERALEWVGKYADCHHAKEEEFLFPVLSERHLANSVKTLISEHAHGEMGIAAMRESLKVLDEGADRFRDAVATFTAIYRSHIDAENTYLVPAIEVQLTPEEDVDMIKGIVALEERILGGGGFETYGHSLDALGRDVLGV